MGDKYHIHHLRAFFIEKIEGHKDVWAHANGKGRYKLKIAHLEADQLEKKAQEKTKEEIAVIKEESRLNAKKVDSDVAIKQDQEPIKLLLEKSEDDDDDDEDKPDKVDTDGAIKKVQESIKLAKENEDRSD